MKTLGKILLLEGIHFSARTRFEDAGFEVTEVDTALSEEELKAKAQGFQAIGIRSKTQLTADFFQEQTGLLAVGAFCIGTNQIDLEAANIKGLPVFNAPYSNTRSVAELVIAEMIGLSRRLGDVNTQAHQGGWLKSAKGAYEVRGKKLGIVGYGHIGSQVSVLAESMGLRVQYFDTIKKLPMGNAVPSESLEELLRDCDFVTLHVPETPITKNMIGTEEMRIMKKGSFLINASRGTVVDLAALKEFILTGHIAGAAIDVFPTEPENTKQKFENELQGVPNVILTPHIGGSTEEAQAAIGLEVAESLTRFLQTGHTLGAVNFPNIDVPPVGEAHRLVNVHKNVPGVLTEINSIVSSTGANIKGQYLSTDPHIGYLVMDMEKGDADLVADQVKKLPTSIITRVVS